MRSLLYYLCAIALLAGCKIAPQDAETEWNTNANMFLVGDRLYIQGTVNSSNVSFFFDSGCLIGCALFDSTATRILGSEIVHKDPPKSWEWKKIEADSIKLGGADFGDNTLNIYEYDHEPMIGPMYATDTRVWHFDLDSCRFSILQEPAMTNPDITLPIVFATSKQGGKIAPFVRVPLRFICGADTLNTNYYYLFDTGTPFGVAITDPTVEMNDFVLRNKHIEYQNTFSLAAKDIVNINFFPSVVVRGYQFDSLKCVVNVGIRSVLSEFSRELAKDVNPVGTIGLRLFKHFNFELDLKNECLRLSRNHTTFPSKVVSKYDFWCDNVGVVEEIGIGGVAYNEGLRYGDTIKAINNIPYSEISKPMFDSLTRTPSIMLSLPGDKMIRLTADN